ncbi:MAG: NB-ARC domain-containing protein [Cyanobacteria bacterium P01_A01_bin.83]
MNLETVVKIVNELVLAQANRQLKEVEKLIIQGAWEGKTYNQIAENCQYSLGYIKQAAAPRLWKLLSKILVKDISKTNFRVVIERLYKKQLQSNPEAKKIKATNTINYPLDWQEAPKVNTCYGRTKELALLKKWLLQDCCQLIAIAGMGGIGKTTLVVSCIEEVQNKFEMVIWRDLRHTTSVSELTIELIQAISRQCDRDFPQDIDDRISILLDNLRQHRCLVVFDTAAAILPNANAKLAENQDYGKLFKRLGEESHQSCLIFSAREKPREVAILEREERPVRSLALKGLGSEAKEILRENKLLDPDRWSELIQIYRGNPLALKIIANTISELFGSKVTAFLRQKTIIFGELNDLLDEQFECLSSLEAEILYWLAIKESSLSLSQLSSALRFVSSQAKLIEALELLLRRSFISRDVVEEEIMFSLPQPIVRQYIIERVGEKICQEIQQVSRSQKVEQLGLLRSLALTENLAELRSNQAQKEISIVQLITNQLCITMRDERLVEEKLTNIISLLSGKTFLVVGYAKSNLEYLLDGLKSGFEGRNEIVTLQKKLF